MAQVLELICATSSPGAIRKASGMLLAPLRRIISWVITKTAAARFAHRALLLGHRRDRNVHRGNHHRRLCQLLDVQIQNLLLVASAAGWLVSSRLIRRITKRGPAAMIGQERAEVRAKVSEPVATMPPQPHILGRALAVRALFAFAFSPYWV